MKFYQFVRRHSPIISEKGLNFRPHISWFTPWKIIAFSLLFYVIIYNINLQKPSQVLGASDDKKIYEEIIFWNDIVKKYPNYRDGYLKLSTLFWKVRLDDQAKYYLEKAKEIDPNNDKVKELEYVFSE